MSITLKTVRLWDIAGGRELSRFKGHEGWPASSTALGLASSVAFNPDGKTLVSAFGDDIACLWDIATGKELIQFKGHENRVNSVAFSPDGKTLASGSDDKTIRLWDIASGIDIAVLKSHEGHVNSVLFSPDGRTLAYASEDEGVRLWDIRPYILFLHNSNPTPLYHTFMKAVRFLWQRDVQGLEIVYKKRTPADLKKYGTLLAPPPPGQSKFDQVLEWAEKQQGK